MELEKILQERFHLHPWAASERIRLLKWLYDFSEDEFLELIETHEPLFTCMANNITEAHWELEKSSLNLSKEQLKTFVKHVSDYPNIQSHLENVEEKLAVLSEHDISKKEIERNYDILKKNPDALRIRTQLAFINGLPLESFTYDGHYTNSHIIWARMQAVKNNLCSNDKIYSSAQFTKNCPYTTDELTKMFPLSDDDIIDIGYMYDHAKKLGMKWQSSYKAFVRNQTAPEESFPLSNEPTKKQKEILKNALNFANNEFTKKDNDLSFNATVRYIQTTFNMDLDEASQMVDRYPELGQTNFSKFKYLKKALEKDYKLSEQDFINIFKAKPSFVQKTDYEYIAYRTFLKEFLLFDDNQIKMLFTQNPEALNYNPQEIISGAQTIKSKINLPYSQITSKFIYYPEIFVLNSDEIKTNIQTYLDFGFDEKTILSHISSINVEPSELLPKLILSRLNNDSDLAFLKTNFAYDINKIYARTMFNLANDLHLPVYRDNEQYHKLFNIHAAEVSYNPTQLTQTLIKSYPLTQEAIDDLIKLYETDILNTNVQDDEPIA